MQVAQIPLEAQHSDPAREQSASPANIRGNLVEVRLVGIRFGARDTNLYEFQSLDGALLPTYDAGAHIDVHIPSGMVRQYSLIHPGSRPRSYVIGVKRDPESRGGSSFMHERLRVGTTITISAPRNNFPLVENADHTVLIAGGIGITPIWCMWQRLKSIGRPVELAYSCRSRADAIFLAEIDRNERVTFNFDDESPDGFLDLEGIVSRAPKHAHLYCCGPLPMLKAFEAVTTNWPAAQVHVEYFTSQAAAANDGGFVVELARSGREVLVEPGQTVLAALIAAGIDVPYSCEEGVCGACMTTVLSGTPDHRDTVLTAEERSRNKKIMICCSGSKSSRLVLDI
jgi:ferredoxin-NADP reductase